MTSRSVLFYGRSLLLSLVAEDLAQSLDLHVVQAATWAKARRALAEHTPDVLVFDLHDSCESHILPLLLKNPNLLLIGLDTERNQAVLLSGQEANSLTLNQFEQIIRRAAPLPGGSP
jgi:hypothetical protein